MYSTDFTCNEVALSKMPGVLESNTIFSRKTEQGHLEKHRAMAESEKGSEAPASTVNGKGYKDDDIVIEGYLRVRANHGIAGLRPW